MLGKVQPGADNFVSEKYAAQLAAILAQWSAALLKVPADTQGIEASLSPDFAGNSFIPAESRLVRSGSLLEVRTNKFGEETTGKRAAFLSGLRGSLAAFSNVATAEFQITSIDVSDPALLKTRVRYELVGSGADFHREQRVGNWELEWAASESRKFLVRKWQVLDETVSRSMAPVFADVTAAALGLNASYSSQLLHGADYWRTVLDGASGIDIYGHNGVSVGDIDGDGFDDLYVCQPAGLPNRLYRNRGDGTFEDVTDAAGVGVLENTACALFADTNNDGRQDLIVVRTNGPLLFVNEGNGKFRQQSNAFQFPNPPQGTFTGAAIADYDRDGWLDIYFCLYIYYQGTDQYKYPLPYYAAENGPPNFMMRNNRDGTFRDVTAQTGLNRNNTRYSFCCAWNDYNQDGWPDLYVVNDFGRKNLYRNNGDGTFTDVAAQAGVEDIGAGMGVSWFDYDNDGADDLYVADMWTAAGERVSAEPAFQKDVPEQIRTFYRKHAMGNSVFHNRRNGSFRDVTAATRTGMGRWSWSCDAWDFDHDGFADIYVVNGMLSGSSRDDLNSFFWRQVVGNSPVDARASHDYEQGWNAINELIRADATWSGYERNVFYANNGDGIFFEVSGAIGLDFIEDGRAFALADIDHDGRLEVVLKNRNGPQVRVLKNVIKNLPGSVVFRLRGTKSNRDAIGAVVTLETDKGKQTRSVRAGSGFLSQHTKELHFGLGDSKGPVRATIRWPSGLVQEINEIRINHRIWVEEGTPSSRMERFNTSASETWKSGPSSEARVVPPSASATRESDSMPKPVSAWKTGPSGPRKAPAMMGASAPVDSTFPDSIETWLLAPIAAPEFASGNTSARPSISTLRGKPLLLNFWSTQHPNWRDQWEAFRRLHTRWASQGLQVLMLNVDGASQSETIRTLAPITPFLVMSASDDTAAIYNILFRYLFDRHRDLPLPTSFLIDGNGDIVKIYQGPIHADHVGNDFHQIPQRPEERMAKALPFAGVSESSDFRRNYLSYGAVYYQRGYFEQAAASFQRAVADDPQSAEALYGMGSALLQQGKLAEARQSFERAVKLQASYPDTLPNAWNNLGLLATREGNTSEAIAHFQQALRLNPDHLVTLVNLGNAYRQLKQWDEARHPLERAVELSPDDAEANYSLAMVFAQTDDSERAYQYLQQALKSRPDYPEALNNLAILYLRTQRRDEAVSTFEQCIQAAPQFDQAYLNLARVYAIEGAPDKARAVLTDLLRQHPGHKQAQKMLAELPQ